MRKRSLKCLADNIFWYVIYMLPVIAFFIYLGSRHGADVSQFGDFLQQFNIPLAGDVVQESMYKIFGPDGILPLGGAVSMLPVFSWYITAMIVHLVVDFLLFIPRLAHKYMNKFTQDGE